MKTRLITLIFAALFSVCGSKLATFLVYPGIDQKSVDWSFPMGTGLGRWSLIFFILLGLACTLAYVGAKVGFLIAKTRERVVIRGFGSSLTGCLFAIAVAVIAVGAVGGFMPIRKPSIDPILEFWWGSYPFVLDFPMYLGIALLIPMMVSGTSLQEELTQTNITEIGRLKNASRLMRLQDEHPDDDVRMASVEKLATLIASGDIRDDAMIGPLASHPDRKTRVRIIESIPLSQQDLVQRLIPKEKDPSVRSLLLSKVSDWRTLLDFYRQEKDENLQAEIVRILLDKTRDSINQDEAYALSVGDGVPLELREYALSVVGTAFLVDLLEPHSDPALKELLENYIQNLLRGDLTSEDAEIIARCNQLPLAYRRQSCSKMDAETLYRMAKGNDSDIAVAAVQRMDPSGGVMAQVAADPQANPAGRMLAISRIGDGTVLVDVATEDQNPAIRKAALDRIQSSATVLQYLRRSKYPEEQQMLLRRIHDIEMLENISADESIPAGIREGIQAYIELIDPDHHQPSTCPVSEADKDWNSLASDLGIQSSSDHSLPPQVCLCCQTRHMAEALANKCPEQTQNMLKDKPEVILLTDGYACARFTLKDAAYCIPLIQALREGRYGVGKLIIKGGLALGLAKEEREPFLKTMGVDDGVLLGEVFFW